MSFGPNWLVLKYASILGGRVQSKLHVQMHARAFVRTIGCLLDVGKLSLGYLRPRVPTGSMSDSWQLRCVRHSQGFASLSSRGMPADHASHRLVVHNIGPVQMDTGDRECFGCGSRSHMKADCPAKYKVCAAPRLELPGLPVC